LRIDVKTGEPIIGDTGLDVTDFFYTSRFAGMDGRANNSANAQEGWADMFMTYMLDGYGIRIPAIADPDLRAGEIRWRYAASGNNMGLAFVMSLYTGAAIRDLTVGGPVDEVFRPVPPLMKKRRRI
jgi:hypothetical protein